MDRGRERGLSLRALGENSRQQILQFENSRALDVFEDAINSLILETNFVCLVHSCCLVSWGKHFEIVIDEVAHGLV